MIILKNTQRKYPLNLVHIKQSIDTILKELGYSDFDISVWFTSDATMRYYNRTYRKKDRATDILSFPYHQLKPGQKIKTVDEEDKNIGDILISPHYVHGVLSLYKVSLQERIDTLLIHGICHLLGYHHDDTDNDLIMRRLEKKLEKILTKK